MGILVQYIKLNQPFVADMMVCGINLVLMKRNLYGS